MRVSRLPLRIFLALVLVILLGSTAGYTEEANGGYAGSFLQVAAGARPTAMGGAYRAVSNDGAAPLFNPSGLATLKRPLFGSSYRAMKLDRSLGYATAIFPIQGEAALGVHWLYAGYGSVEARDSDGDLLGREINMNNHQFTIIFAKRFERYLSLGLNASYLAAYMPEMDANSVGFDFGVTFYVDQLFDRDKRESMPVRDIQFALTVSDIAKEFKWTSEEYLRQYTTDLGGQEQSDKVPVEIGFGASARFFDRHLLLASDLVKHQHQNLRFHGGAEYYLLPEFALRAGYGDKRFTAGTGYLFKLGKHQLVIDYAFSTDKADEGSEHIFSFDFLY